ncbi:chromosome partitioning protein ParA [Vibrio parahaemolyticus]|uniref:chromosome partitioning protein ParA n=1 Tax=Vibrio parahaemolyticus TaxID=670 RepID=UPI0011201304|nr:chromosome partitioning protein ParA [Vibrio parahaemolyticus]MBE3817016.1 chromosome partitioning protein ParA [Vibrio parahaemolyticus]MBE3884798.1 chromosome partitioning protein ParA [Vibrio parahaemolyticus]MBE4178356.1 chromosome partitioning protein ParA [Vibrio parahaemolyticus]MBE4236568.1 chromosome partitioning protein ParA [Vibrio parahaemolyticus]MBE4263501.1 chromosome partitioning protein ParA [Vibrio parahaemolyticus]
MSISDVKDLVQMFGSFGIGAIVGAGFLFFILKSFLPSYFSEKAKNLATKEDIGQITSEVEQVKSGCAEMLEEVKSNHQLRLASIEREKLLKKEVYLDSVEALSKYQGALAVMSNLDIPNQVIADAFSASAAQIAKMNMVGTEKTVRSLTNFTGEVGAAYMSLFLERGGLISRKSHIEFLETYNKKHNDEIERCLTIMKNMNLEGITDNGAWDRVNKAFENECKSRDQFVSEINLNWAVQNEEHLKFTERCMSEFFRVNDLTPHLLLSVRDELELELNETEYLEIHSESTKEGKEVFESFMNNLRDIA